MVKDIMRIQYAESTLPESWVFGGGKEENRVPIVFSVFLVCTQKKKILVDAGCETMPKFDMKNFITPMRALKENGFDIADITDVIITHAHHDHIECVKYFPDAMVHIQQEEYGKGGKYLTHNPHIRTFADEAVVDDGVKVVKIGGHSRGSCVVECKTGDKITVLCGDECYSMSNIQNRIPTAKTVCPENSKAFIEKYTQDPYVCLLCHDLG